MARRKTLFLFLLILGVILAVGFFLYSKKEVDQEGRKIGVPTDETTFKAEASARLGWQTFSHDGYGFSLEYPSDLSVLEFPEGDFETTFAFKKEGERKGFQIFVFPFEEEDGAIPVSLIKAEFPDFTVEDSIEVVIGGGTHALLFESRSPEVGATQELWFAHKGYLYQVTTYLDESAWLAEIMETWNFN